METLLVRVYEAGFCSNQASVKYLIEWVIILTLHWHPVLVDTLWRCFGVVVSTILAECKPVCC